MAYIGTSPSNGVRRIHTYTATANQTTFTGSSTEGVTLTYADTNYIDVFQNGVLLGSADYTSTSGTSVVLAQGASVSDLVVIVVYDVFSVADTVSKTSGGSFDSAVTMSSTLDVTGALSAKGGAVFNEDSADVDFRVESNGDANCLFVDGGNNVVSINNNVASSMSTDSNNLVVGSGSGNEGITIFSATNGTGNIYYADGSSGDALKTNGSGTLSFGSVTTTGAFTAFEYTATAAQTSFSGNDDNSNSLAYTSGVNNVFVTVNGVMLDGSDYTATNGTAVVLSAAAAANDIVKILATNASSITTADLDGAEFVLDADGDTTIHADTDDQIDIKIAGADDFRFTANNFNVLSGSTLTIDSGATITNNGTDNNFGLTTGKTIVFAMLFGS